MNLNEIKFLNKFSADQRPLFYRYDKANSIMKVIAPKPTDPNFSLYFEESEIIRIVLSDCGFNSIASISATSKIFQSEFEKDRMTAIIKTGPVIPEFEHHFSVPYNHPLILQIRNNISKADWEYDKSQFIEYIRNNYGKKK